MRKKIPILFSVFSIIPCISYSTEPFSIKGIDSAFHSFPVNASSGGSEREEKLSAGMHPYMHILENVSNYSVTSAAMFEMEYTESCFKKLVSGNKMNAFQECREEALNGDAEAQMNLGIMYARGDNVKQDYREARKWLEASASQGFAQGEYNLGVMYLHGRGVDKDYHMAREWFEKSAQKGYAGSWSSLGLMYELGLGLESDRARAFEFFEKAAKKKHAPGEYLLALSYLDGEGGKQGKGDRKKTNAKSKKDAKQANIHKGLNHLKNAAKNNYAPAASYLARFLMEGTFVRKQPEEALKWYEAAAKKGDIRALLDLGLLYEEGIEVEKDDKEAFNYFMIAAKKGDANAQNAVGTFYNNDNTGVKQNFKKAYKWCEKAAEQGHLGAQYNIGNMLYHGRGVRQNYQKAREYFERLVVNKAMDTEALACANRALGIMYFYGHDVVQDYGKAYGYFKAAEKYGDPEAIYAIGLMYAQGKGLEENHKKALQYYKVAANKGHPKAQSNLGAMYRHGIGTEKNLLKARDYFEKAARQGDFKAQTILAGLKVGDAQGSEKMEKANLHWLKNIITAEKDVKEDKINKSVDLMAKVCHALLKSNHEITPEVLELLKGVSQDEMNMGELLVKKTLDKMQGALGLTDEEMGYEAIEMDVLNQMGYKVTVIEDVDNLILQEEANKSSSGRASSSGVQDSDGEEEARFK